MSKKRNRRALDEIAADIHALQRTNLFAIGDLLIEAKEQLEHGEWLPWLEEEEFGVSSAENCMRASRLRTKFPNIGNLKLARTTIYTLTDIAAEGDTTDELMETIIAALAEVATDNRLKPADADMIIELVRLRVRFGGDYPDATLFALDRQRAAKPWREKVAEAKTTLLALIELLVSDPHRTDDISPAAVYYHLGHKPGATLLIDEADNAGLLDNRMLRAVFNSGHRKGGGVTRIKDGWPKRFPTFCPLVIAAIGSLPLPLLHRSVLINMQRKAPDEIHIERLDESGPDWFIAREQIQKWAATCALEQDPEIPLVNRAADNWRVLLSIADSLGHGEAARSAARELTANRPDEDPGVILLGDILAVFSRRRIDRIASADLVNELIALNDFWHDWRERPGRKLTQGDLGRLLRPFRIKPKSIWPVERTPTSRSRKGYTRDQFEAAWRSYCPGGTPAQPRKFIRLATG